MSDQYQHLLSTYVQRPLTDPKTINDALTEAYQCAYNGACHVLRGRVRVPDILPGFAFVLHRIVPLPGRDGDLVKMGGKGTMYRASFLRSLADTAGIRHTSTTRCDDRTDGHLAEYEVVLEGTDLLMRARKWMSRYQLDLRDGSPRADQIMTRAKTTDDGQRTLDEKRTFITQQAETGAYTRAMTEALAIQRGFKNGDLAALDIILPSVEIHAAAASPAQRERMADMAMARMMGAWGPAPAAPAPPPPPAPSFDDIPEEPAPVDEEHPFHDEDDEPWDEPPEEVVDRPINDDEKEYLKRIGVYTKPTLRDLGWQEGQPVMLSVYQRAVAEYGGASS